MSPRAIHNAIFLIASSLFPHPLDSLQSPLWFRQQSAQSDNATKHTPSPEHKKNVLRRFRAEHFQNVRRGILMFAGDFGNVRRGFQNVRRGFGRNVLRTIQESYWKCSRLLLSRCRGRIQSIRKQQKLSFHPPYKAGENTCAYDDLPYIHHHPMFIKALASNHTPGLHELLLDTLDMVQMYH